MESKRGDWRRTLHYAFRWERQDNLEDFIQEDGDGA